MDDSTAALVQRVRGLVQHAIVRRLWILLVAPGGALLPELQQVDGIPVSPDGCAVLSLRGILGHVVEPDVDAVLVIERPGPARPGPDDWAWHAMIAAAARAEAVTLRDVLLAHDGGVERMEADPGPPGR